MASFNLLDQIAKHLEFVGLGTIADSEQDGTIFWGRMPDAPDACICVFSTDSQYCGSDSGARIQVYVRAKNPKLAYELSQAVADELVDFNGFLAGDGAQVSITPINVSAGLGADEKNRELYSSNFTVRYCNC